ncbi:hypothetical protein [Pseudomonas japonica]|uniref:hypothetical protein n=1 Tax=Pseudomonas japonica TaxID=256466 RepID=UPI0015E3AB1D|nr:hypothetical protein [Pseudomonas japonica]MBA1243835.1 hypothetical protein [Pseudomonas japonica]
MSSTDQDKKDIYISSDGRKVRCTIKNHPYFNGEGNICSALLFVFIHVCTTRCNAIGYQIQSAILAFLTYLSQYNIATHIKLKVLNISDITAEIFLDYVSFCQREAFPKSYPPSLKAGIKATALETGKIPILALPILPGQKGKPTEPLYDDGYESLQSSLITHIDKLYGQLESRSAIERAQPYTYEELADLALRQIPKDDFVHWWRTTTHWGRGHRRDEVIRRLKLCTDRELRETQNKPELLKTVEKLTRDHVLPDNFISNNVAYDLQYYSEWYPDDARVIKTFLVNGYPIGMLFDEVQNIADPKFSRIADCDTTVKLLVNRIRFSSGANRRTILWPLDWYFADYYPRSIDMSAIIVFIMLQSGWNQESVMSLDKDKYEHALTGAINADQVVVFGEKFRSQGYGKSYPDPEPIFAPSDGRNPYSIVSLIRLANKLSRPLQGIPFDSCPERITTSKLNQLFLFLRESGEWCKSSRHTSISFGPYFRQGVKEFLKEYEIFDNGIRVTNVKKLTLRLRPTWVKYKQPGDNTGFLSRRLHHKSRTTTDIFYDSSSQAEQKRKVKLRSEQEEVMRLIRARAFSGLVVNQKLAEAKKISSMRIFAIPGIERPLWGCSGGIPNWPGAESLSQEGKCYSLENCWFCGCQMVFEDSLPFMIERLVYIEEFLDGDTEPSFKNRLASERKSIMEVMDKWEDEEAIREAIRYQKVNGPLMPPDLSVLKLIFKTGDL